MSGVLESDSSTRVEKGRPRRKRGIDDEQNSKPSRTACQVAGWQRTAPPLPGVVHGRSATTAVVGGAAAANAKHSAAAVNGAAIKRKPWLI